MRCKGIATLNPNYIVQAKDRRCTFALEAVLKCCQDEMKPKDFAEIKFASENLMRHAAFEKVPNDWTPAQGFDAWSARTGAMHVRAAALLCILQGVRRPGVGFGHGCY